MMRQRWILWSVLGCTGLLVGCGSGESTRLAPVEIRSVGSFNTAPVSSRLGGASDVSGCIIERGFIQVIREISLNDLAWQCGLSVQALIHLNGLTPPYIMRGGQRLAIPATLQVHEVQPGDTLDSLSFLYNIAPEHLIYVNQLRPPYDLQIGQKISVKPAPSNVVGQYNHPESGHAGGGIRQPRIQQQILSDPSVSSAPFDQRNGSLHGPDLVPELVTAPPPGPRPHFAMNSPSMGQTQQSSNQVAQPSSVRSAFSRLTPPVTPPAADGYGPVFTWPLDGKIISRFGPKAEGIHNDGINIKAPALTPVRAAEAGTVAYAGDGLKGFGNLLLIRHKDGYVTAYAHNADLLVRRGEKVQRGQTIARVGTTGTVTSAQLHFQVRKGSQALDPAKVLLASAEVM